MVLHEVEAPKPERGNLIQNGTLLRNRIGQDDVEGGQTIGRDKEERVAEIEDFADFAGAQFRNAGKFEIAQRRHEQSGKQEHRKNQKNSCFPVFLIHYFFMGGIVVKPRARIFHGHDWVFSGEVLKVFGNPADGDVISLKDGKDRLIGSAIYNSKSQIVARRFSRRRQDLDIDFFRRRIAQASEYRDRRDVDPKLRRVVWSESDGLPGVITDRYGDDLVLQTLTLAMDLGKHLIVEAIEDVFCRASASLAGAERLAGEAPVLQALTIIERNDAAVRKAEGLESRKGILRGTGSQIAIEIEGVKLELDLLHGQKTGFYLDQRHNYGIVAG